MAAEKGGTGGDGQISRLGIDMSASGLSGRKPLIGWHLVGIWLALGGPFLSSFARMGLEKSSRHVGSPFLLFLWSAAARTVTH